MTFRGHANDLTGIHDADLTGIENYGTAVLLLD